MPAKRTIVSFLVAVILAMGAGYFSRPYLDSDYVSAAQLTAEDSPVVVIPKENLGQFLQYVEQLKRAFEECQAGKSL